MKTSLEIQVLQLFEQALAQPVALRMTWLAGQGQPDEVVARVMRLLEAERAATGFLEETAVIPDEVPPEFPKVGERLGNYELLKPLEAGGMGVVYLGRRADNVYDQQVAIKLVRPVHLLATAAFRRQLISRFEDERSILARMSHPNVARILDGGSTVGGIPYLVMEYVDGVSLTDYCRNQKLDVPARLALFCKVCDGVQEAHRHLIVHRDLKPDNVLVGANGEPRLLDFGIAKILEQEPLGTDKGTSLSAMTPAYASPEQVRQEALTTSSDVYSLGVVLYQMIAGVRPYELGGLRPAEAEHVVCDTLPDPMRKMLDKAAITDGERKLRRAQITPDVERIVGKAMHKESARRYGSAQELADDIRRYLAGEPVQAHPDSAGYRLRKFLGRHRVGAAAAALALLAILTATGVAFWQAEKARRAANDTFLVNHFLIDMLKSSDPYNSGSDIPFSQAMDEASARVGANFRGRPDIATAVRAILGASMVSRGRFEMAERELGLALRDATEAYGPESISALSVRVNQATLLKEQDRHDESMKVLQDVVASIEGQGLLGIPAYFVALSSLGEAHLQRDEIDAADALFQRALALPPVDDPKLRSPSDGAVLKVSLALVAHSRGELDLAESRYREAIAELETLHPQGSPELATALINLSSLKDEREQPDQAYELLKRAMPMRERSFNADHPLVIGVWAMVIQRALDREDPEYALSLARKAGAATQASLLQAEPLAIYAHYLLAEALFANDKVVEAEQVLAEARVQVDKMPPEARNLRNLIADLSGRICQSPQGASLALCTGG